MTVQINYSLPGCPDQFQPQMREIDGRWFMEWNHNPHWIALGYAPVPKNDWQWILYHLGHGLLMQYGVFAVLKWTLLWYWRNRNEQTEAKDESSAPTHSLRNNR